MTIDLPPAREIQQQLAEFRTAITERLTSLEAGDRTDGEATMARLIAELAPW